MLNRIELKQGAKAITRSASVSAYRFTFIYLLVVAVLNGADNYMRLTDSLVVYMGGQFVNIGAYLPFTHAPFPTAAVVFVGVLVWLLGSVLQAGWVLYHQGVRRGEEMPYSTLFDGFGFTGKIILLNLVIGLFVFLWSLLLVIPGIIAIYRYRFALYNLCENPELGVMDALRLSKQQTMGFKLDLFVLDVTFIGWGLLCGLTLGILSIWIQPYIQQTDLAYFDAIRAAKGMNGVDAAEDDGFRPDDRF